MSVVFLEEDEIRRKLDQVHEKMKALAEGRKEFGEGMELLKQQEAELKKELELSRKLHAEEGKVDSIDRKLGAKLPYIQNRSSTHYAIYAIAFLVILLVAAFAGLSWHALPILIVLAIIPLLVSLIIGLVKGDKYGIYCLTFTLIVFIAIYLRTSLTHYWGFYEPDDFYHYSVIRAAVNNNFFVPENLSISGWPTPELISEPRGLYWVTLAPYFVLRFVGITYYEVERYISLVYGLMDMIGAYFLARFLSKDKFFLLLVMILVAMSSGDAARTSALIYRGDSFVTIFLIMSLIFFLYVFKTKTKHEIKISSIVISGEKLLCATLAGIALAGAEFVWNGAPFVTIIYLLSIFMVMFYAFLKSREDILKDSAYIIYSFLLWFIFISLMLATGQIWGSATPIFTGKNFLAVFLFLIGGWVISYYIMNRRDLSTRLTPMIRALTVIVIIAAGFGAIYAFDYNLLQNILINNGVIVTSSFSATIQELTPPTYNFLFASFGYALYSTPMSMIMASSTVYSTLFFHSISATSIAREESGFIFWIIMLLTFIPYFFMKVYDSGGFLKGNARLRFGVDIEMIVLMVFFATTAFLQIYAIRFNSLIAVPLAIFGAYTIYWLTLFAKRFEITRIVGTVATLAICAALANSVLSTAGTSQPTAIILGIVDGAAAAGVVYMLTGDSKDIKLVGSVGLFILLAVNFGFGAVAFSQSGFAGMFTTIVAAIAAYGVYVYTTGAKNYELFGYMVAAAFLITLFYFDVIFSANIAPADTMGPQLFSALNWLKNNSATNSVVLTLWPDGSVVEGVANRTSIMDSVGSQNAYKSEIFADWLLNASDDASFLDNPNISRPDYLVVRYVWLLGESAGIYQESSLNSSLEQDYAFAPLTSFNEAFNNDTEQFGFSNGQSGSGALNAVVILHRNNTFQSYLTASNGGISPFTYVAFTNVNTGNFTISKQTYYNETNGQMLLIQYSDIPSSNPALHLNITGAIVFTQGMANSNLVKFLYFCGTYTGCLWNNTEAGLRLVYSNSDTRIFQIVYNNTT